MKSTHANANETFLKCISNGSKMARSKRKVGTNHFKDDSDEGEAMKIAIEKTQLTLKESSKNKHRFSQSRYENKVC